MTAAAEAQGAGQIIGFWHPGVTSGNLDASIAFYRDGLGLTLEKTAPSSSVAQHVWNLPGATGRVAFFSVPGSDVTIEIYEILGVERHSASSRPCDPAHGHMCFYVDDLQAMYDRLVGLGYRARSNGVVTIVDGDLAGAKAVYMIDPDGYHVELYQQAP